MNRPNIGPKIAAGRSIRSRAACPRSRSRQGGMTAVGMLILAVFIGLFAFAAIRLTPVYLNYLKVAGVLNGVYEEFDGQNSSRGMIRKSVQRRFDVESVSVITFRDINVSPENNGFRVAAIYDHTSPFIGNISFTVHFNKQVLIRR